MKILQIYDHAGISSGIVSVLVAWHKYNIHKNVEFDFLFTKKISPSYESEILKYGGKIFYINEGEKKLSPLNFIYKVRGFFKKYRNRYDGVHLHSANFAFPFLYYAKKYKVPLRILHVHSAVLGNKKISSIRNIPLVYLNKFWANKFIACSTNAAKVWFDLLRVHDFDILPNPLEVEKYSENIELREKVRHQLGIEDSTILLGHISNMTPLKEVPFVIDILHEMVKNNHNYKLVLIGKDSLPSAVKEKITKNSLDERVINLGVRNDLDVLIHAIDVCVMPSKSEGFGMVPLECQAANVPVIISDNFPKEINVTNKVSVLENNLEVWCTAVSKFASERFVPNDLNELKINFSLQTIVPQLYRIYGNKINE